MFLFVYHSVYEGIKVNAKGIVIGLLSLSVAVIVWLILDSHTTYAPTVSATEIQNIYIRQIVRVGFAVIALQLIAVGLLVTRK